MKSTFVKVNALNVARIEFNTQNLDRTVDGYKTVEICSGKSIIGNSPVVLNVDDIEHMSLTDARIYDLRDQISGKNIELYYKNRNDQKPYGARFKDFGRVDKEHDIEPDFTYYNETVYYRSPVRKVGVVTLRHPTRNGLGINGIEYSDQVFYLEEGDYRKLEDFLCNEITEL